MYRGVDSLNVAAAAAVAFFELCRGLGLDEEPDAP
jgi:tRNA G18 (ribose-2'-O)-methylase SpoU